jgi:alpha-mannosidase
MIWPRLAVPRGLEDDRQYRSDEMVRCPITTEVTLTAGVNRIEFRTTVHNAAMDHRLRVLFPTSSVVAAHDTAEVRAEGHFAVIARPASAQGPSGRWQEQPSPTHHTLGGVAADQLLLMTKGLPEYEAVAATHGSAPGRDLALTLLRCVGWLSREDLATRPGHAGPPLATPGAQCLGEHIFEYAISFRSTGTDTEIVRAAQDYRYDFALGPSTEGALPALLQVEGEGFAFSALKGAEDGRGVILRVFNPGGEPAWISLPGEHRSLRVCRLDEAETAVTEAPARIDIGPYEIVTLRVE